jgi:hypothetical protein
MKPRFEPVARCGWLALAVAAGACATVSEFERVQASWIGEPIERYLEHTGLLPSEVIPNQEGDVYVFSFSRDLRSPVRTTEESLTLELPGSVPSNPYPGASPAIRQECTWRYRTDEAGIIRGFEFEGNACQM